MYTHCLKVQIPKLWQQYKKCRNKLIYTKDLAKKLCLQNLIVESKHKTAELRKTINNILHYRKKKTTQIPPEIHVNNEIVHGPKSISNAFNDYFVNGGNSCLIVLLMLQIAHLLKVY